jgi:hypothetical protein
MGLVQDQRPRDWTYQVAFDKKDLPSLQEMARHIRETHDTDMIEDFNLKCEQKLTGANEPAVLDNGLEIKAVTKSNDLVVNGGLDHCIKIILGQVSTRWSHIGVGSGVVPAALITDTTVASESLSARINTAAVGWREAVGMKLFFGGVLGEDYPLTSISNIGVYNGAASGDVLLNHTVFNNNLLTRIQDHAVFIFSSVVEFCPVA